MNATQANQIKVLTQVATTALANADNAVAQAEDLRNRALTLIRAAESTRAHVYSIQQIIAAIVAEDSNETK